MASKKELEKRIEKLEEKIEILAQQHIKLLQEVQDLKKPKEPSYLA